MNYTTGKSASYPKSLVEDNSTPPRLSVRFAALLLLHFGVICLS